MFSPPWLTGCKPKAVVWIRKKSLSILLAGLVKLTVHHSLSLEEAMTLYVCLTLQMRRYTRTFIDFILLMNIELQAVRWTTRLNFGQSRDLYMIQKNTEELGILKV